MGAAMNDQDSSACPQCGQIFEGATICDTPSDSTPSNNETSRQTNWPDSWIDTKGPLVPSTKTLAIKAQILDWTDIAPDEKIIIFTQFHSMIKILSRLCKDEGWNALCYHGKMSHDSRHQALQDFKNRPDVKILIISLMCGGAGLNITCANRVILVDLFYNSAVENQAFARVHRVNQSKETHIARFCVKNSFDERLLAMQKRKSRRINKTMGDVGNEHKGLSISELLVLFGIDNESSIGQADVETSSTRASSSSDSE